VKKGGRKKTRSVKIGGMTLREKVIPRYPSVFKKTARKEDLEGRVVGKVWSCGKS